MRHLGHTNRIAALVLTVFLLSGCEGLLDGDEPSALVATTEHATVVAQRFEAGDTIHAPPTYTIATESGIRIKMSIQLQNVSPDTVWLFGCPLFALLSADGERATQAMCAYGASAAELTTSISLPPDTTITVVADMIACEAAELEGPSSSFCFERFVPAELRGEYRWLVSYTRPFVEGMRVTRTNRFEVRDPLLGYPLGRAP